MNMSVPFISLQKKKNEAAAVYSRVQYELTNEKTVANPCNLNTTKKTGQVDIWLSCFWAQRSFRNKEAKKRERVERIALLRD